MPFNADRGLVEIPVTINNLVTGSFGIDTGADRLYVDRTFALKHNLADPTISPQRKVAGVDGNTTGIFTTFRSLAIGDERLYNVKATVIDINAISRKSDGSHPDGLIGYEVLSRLYVTVDYPARQIELRVDRPRFLNEGRPREIGFDTRKHLIIVDATFSDGRARPMILDFCASYTSVSAELAAELGIDSSPGTIESVGQISLEDVITTDNVNVIVTDFARYRKSLRRVKFDGILGGTFLYRHKITISYKQDKIYLHD
jgi:predicted aspartyl protease